MLSLQVNEKQNYMYVRSKCGRAPESTDNVPKVSFNGGFLLLDS